jgi:cell surface protein SprA
LSDRNVCYGNLQLRSLLLLLALLSPLGLTAQTDTLGRERVPERAPAVPRQPLSPFDDPFPYEAYRHRIEFDSASNGVRLYESAFGTPFGNSTTMTLDEYLARRREEQERRAMEEWAKKYELTPPPAKKDDLEKIIGQGTEITIPIPQNPLFSIFGPPTVSISVNGSIALSAGWQWDNNNLTSISALGSTQSAPFFNQDIQVAVSGKVGDKLKLTADFQTERTFDFDNQLKIAFGGGPESDDDIIQGVEAGNVQLQTPSTLIGGSQALFGVKTSFKFGPLFLTTIASQKRGERKTLQVAGGAVKNHVVLKPYDYAQNHFWIDTVYKGFYDTYFKNSPPAATGAMARYNVIDIEVYEQVKDGSIPSQFKAIAYADLPRIDPGSRYPETLRVPPANASSGEVQRGSFRRLNQGTDFEIDRQLGTLTIRLLQVDRTYAIAYRTATDVYGEFSNTRADSTQDAILKLVYVSNMQPNFRTLWSRQMKNIYPLQGARNIDLENSSIKITYGVPPDTSEVFRVNGSPRVVTVLGVDRTNSSNQPTPDGEFDIRSPYFLDPVRGELIFPSVEPFRKRLREQLGGDAEPFVLDAIYDQTRDEAQRDTRVSKFTIGGDIAGTGGSKISLGSFYLAPGSIKVISNGESLVENVDYRVDPVYGEVTLISPRANSATGNLQIEYEQNDFATIANKTLLGVRADYDLLNKRNLKSKLGMTLMRYGQSLPTDKVQIYSGDESVTNLMLGFDGWVNYNADFLTRALDALPLIDTKEPSELKLSGEVAWSMPNPNTKVSLVESDAGLGAAYIDDFESGAKRQIQLGVSYTSWHPASAPVDFSIGADDTSRLRNKGHFFWYNRTPAVTPTSDIWPNKDPAFGSQKTAVLDMIFEPERRGVYNMNPEFESAGFPRDSVWGGMMRSLSFYASNLNEDNIDYIEIVMNVDQADPDAKLYIDMGQISEDVIPNFNLNTEDGITPQNTQQDDVLNDGEDVGIDGLTDDQERARFPVFTGEADPARDNYAFINSRNVNPDPAEYRNVNGEQGNLGQERAPIPDSEDLNGNRGVDLDNSYFRYEVNLELDPLKNDQIVGIGQGKWRHYRIPIRTNPTKVGNPSFSNVQFVRVSVKSRSRMQVRVAEFNLVGSDWRNLDVATGDTTRDPKLEIAFVNIEDNGAAPDFYTTPPGVDRELDKNTETFKNEQSLSVHVRNLERGATRAAVRVRPRPFDVFNYKQMKFFLHGGGDMDAEQIGGQSPKVIAYMRFGWDSLNYYEYRVPLLKGWNEYVVNFADLAAIKTERGRVVGTGIADFPVPGQPTARFAIRGIPSLTRVQFIAFGIENNAYPADLTTTMWVDELRAVGAEDANDWAATLQAQVKMADIGNVNVNTARTNPNFHRLEERFGNRVEANRWALNSIFNLEKLLPNDFKGSSIPFTYTHEERLDKPRYVSESDVEVDAAIRQIGERTGIDPAQAAREADDLRLATQTLVTQDAFSFSNFRIAFPGTSWPIRYLANNLTFGYDYNQIRERSPLVEQRFAWKWDFRGRYQVSIPANFDIKPFTKVLADVPLLGFWKDFKINFLPSTFAANTGVHRERRTEQLRDVPDPSPVVRDFNTTRAAQFSWRMTEGGIINLTTDYSVDARSSLNHLETDGQLQQRSGAEIARDLFFNEGRLFNFGRDNDLSQSITFNPRPRIPFIPGVERFVTPTARYNVKYDWEDQLTQNLGEGSFTKSAQWNSTGTLGLDIRLNDIGDALFGDPTGRRQPTATPDSTSESTLKTLLRYLIKVPFLEFNTLRFSFTQNNGSKNPGVVGATGVSNLWGRTLLFRSESPDFGPGAAYQLGLISDPHGTLNFDLGGGFPFIHTTKDVGVRAPGIYVQDNYTQKNTLSASTDRALWPGASINITWATDWGYNRNQSVTTDLNGIPTFSNPLVTGNISRTYFSLPDWFIFEGFNNDIEGVVDEYRARKGEVAEPVAPAAGAPAAEVEAYNRALVDYNKQITEIISQTFEQQLEALNWLPGKLGEYLPRMNWAFQWNGLENLPVFNGWASNASISSAYNGRFNRNFRETDEGRVPETQTVSRGFSPLVRLNITGKPDVFNGTSSAQISYNTTTDFALVTAARSEISKELKSELQAQLGYQRRGMKLPLFGLNLKNDVEFQMLFSYGRTNRKRFNLTDFRPEGNNDGSTRISFRPSIRYTLSNAVTASAFVSYEATIPDEEGSRDIRRSTTKVGLDIRLGISGGR